MGVLEINGGREETHIFNSFTALLSNEFVTKMFNLSSLRKGVKGLH